MISDWRKIELAQDSCKHYHKGNFRKGSNEQFYVHPFNVAKILRTWGYHDVVTQCIAYLHDTVEDTSLTIDQINDIWGYEIADGVYVLSRNKGKSSKGSKLTSDEYLQRLGFARNKIKRVKIADIIDNTRDLQNLKVESIQKKISDGENFFIPWGNEIAPLMVRELETNILNYRQKIVG